MESVITVIGKDAIGIIAKVSTMLVESEINIIDISQTTNDDQFLMVMIVDTSASKVSFFEMEAALKALGKEMGLRIQARHKKVFDSMHRI